MPGVIASLIIGAVGAILRYAVNEANFNGLNVHTTGGILMVVGAIGLAMSLLFWASFSPFARRGSTSRVEEIVVKNGQEQGHIIRETRDNTP